MCIIITCCPVGDESFILLTLAEKGLLTEHDNINHKTNKIRLVAFQK